MFPRVPGSRAYAQRWLPCALVLILGLVASTGPARAQLASLETPGLQLVYVDPSGKYLVPHVERAFLNSLEFQRRVLGFAPTDDITVLLLDLADGGNAGATAVPHDLLLVQMAPLSHAFETVTANERMTMIMNHELVHVTTMDRPAGRDRFFRKLFVGKVRPTANHPETILYSWLTAPRAAAPRWYIEGAGVFFDTWMAAGIGRAQGGYDEMVFRSMVRDGTEFYDPLGLISEGTKVDFNDEANSYLYGTRFMTWLARTYTPQKVAQSITRQEHSRAYYASNFPRIFGLRMRRAWANWVRDEHAFQQQNLEAVRKYPLTPYQDLTPRGLGAVSRAYYDAATRTLYAGVSAPGIVSHIAALSLDTGAVDRLVDIKGPSMYTVTSLTRDPSDGTLYYTTDNGAYRDLVRLDPKTRRTKVMLKDGRIGDLAFNRADGAIWGIRHVNGIATLVRIPKPYAMWEQVHSWPYGTVMYDLDLSPDGTRLVASFGEIDGKQDVRVFDIAAFSKAQPTPLARFDFGPSVPNHFVFSPDGRHVYGSAYYTGVSNIFRYEIAAQKLEAVTNTDTGFFRPLPLDDGSLIAFRYSGQGFVPARLQVAPIEDIAPITFLGERLAEEHPVVRDWALGSPMQVDIAQRPTVTGKYSPFRRMAMDSLYPIVQSYKGTGAPGVRFSFSDPLQFSRGNLAATYSVDTSLPSAERLHLQTGYERGDWRGGFEFNGADFYDFFGPTRTSRKGYVLSGGRRMLLVYDAPKRLELNLGGSFAGNLDALPDYQNVEVDVDRLATVTARLSWSDIRNSLGHVDDEKGNKWTVAAQAQRVSGRAVPRFGVTQDQGLVAFGQHSTLWLRSAAGFSPGDQDDPFANFYFGAFGNNWVDHLDEKRYRSLSSFPGAALNGIGGRNFIKSALELNLPPWRFRRVGRPGLHATWLRPAVFVGGLATNIDDDAVRRLATNIGTQMDVRLTVLSTMPLTLSFGGAIAFEDGRGPRREAMVSLKDPAVSIALALLPVLLFLVGLSLMDSFKLVPRRAVLRSLLGGAVAALVAGVVLDSGLFEPLPVSLLVGYAGPVVEECAKAALVAWLVWSRRVGFLVDAALLGFAVGAGFALVENVVYLYELGDVPLGLWLVRGLGTAVMHGGTTAVFAMLARQLTDRFPRRGWLMFVPGLLVAIVVHGTFNRLLLPPLAQTALIVAVLPLLMLVVFERSERVTREWVGAGLDLDVELLQLVTSEHFEVTRFASYLRSLRDRFPGPIVADMFCLLRLELELSVQAKALVLARGAGLQLPADDDLEAALGEYAFLKRSIGRTGLLALRPVQVTSDRDDWHSHLLTQARRVPAKR